MENLKTSTECIFKIQSFQRELKKTQRIPGIFKNFIIFLSYHIHFWVVGSTILADLTLSQRKSFWLSDEYTNNSRIKSQADIKRFPDI